MTNADERQTLTTAAEFAAETLVPGGANIVKGDLKNAGIYAAIGLAARFTFGLPGLLLVSADSFTKATTGRRITEHLGLWQHETPAQPPAAPTNH
ncbi:MAG TPA: DUF6072 family protein [Bryobacteraceae bacterium]|jgi:hypothetical protein|nr:DUF6072 family protein [Bryobacteraceae bacterium]